MNIYEDVSLGKTQKKVRSVLTELAISQLLCVLYYQLGTI